MNCRQAYDELMAYHLFDNTATASAQDPNGSAHDNTTSGGGIDSGNDWVGTSPRAGLAANNDAKQFLAHHEGIRNLWQVSLHCMSSKIIVMQSLITCCSLDTLLCCLLRSRVCSLVMPHRYQSPSSSNR